MEAFTVWRTVPQDDNVNQLEVIASLTWKYMPCKRTVKLYARVCDLLFRGLTFVPLYGASHLLGLSLTISESNQKLSPVLFGRSTPFEYALDWLKFTYTPD